MIFEPACNRVNILGLTGDSQAAVGRHGVMDLKSLSDNWNRWGEMDPMWAVLTNPQHRGNQWEANPFFETGFGDISHCLKTVSELRFPLPAQRRSTLAAASAGCRRASPVTSTKCTA